MTGQGEVLEDRDAADTIHLVPARASVPAKLGGGHTGGPDHGPRGDRSTSPFGAWIPTDSAPISTTRGREGRHPEVLEGALRAARQ